MTRENPTPKQNNEPRGMTRRDFVRTLLTGAAASAILGESGDARAHDGCVDEDPHFTTLSETKKPSEIGSLDPIIDPVYGTKRNFTGEILEGYENCKILLPSDVVKKTISSNTDIT